MTAKWGQEHGERNEENQARPNQHAQTGGREDLSQAANPLDRDLSDM